jgi:hypothetical protein
MTWDSASSQYFNSVKGEKILNHVNDDKHTHSIICPFFSVVLESFEMDSKETGRGEEFLVELSF